MNAGQTEEAAAEAAAAKADKQVDWFAALVSNGTGANAQKQQLATG